PAEPGAPPGESSAPTVAVGGSSRAVREQLDELENGGGLPEFKAEFVSENEIIVPSLMDPPMPLSQVILAFLYVVPIFFVSIFFTSSFMEEKLNRKLNILLSAPVTPLQIIAGKMLPYFGYSLVSIIAITLALGGDILLAVVIFVPIVLFIFSLYLMVALLYRTFKDQTFFSLLAVTLITVYLVFPSMFSGISELSHISPLHLAIQMYKGEAFGLSEYMLATTPMYLMFGVGLFIGVRIFNEEFLMGFRPLHRKLGDAVLLTINRRRLHLSILLLSLFLIPTVFMVQLASLVIAFNLPTPLAIVVALTISVVVEEIAKSAGIVVLIQNRIALSMRRVLTLSAMSALGFFAGEKFLLWIALKVIPQSTFTDAIFGTGLLIIPLLAHFFFTAMVCLISARFGAKRYVMAIAAGSLLHILYNLLVAGVLM
ncbi:MAG: ABC transporter permease, partial [Dehalococcoidales bacterium]